MTDESTDNTMDSIAIEPPPLGRAPFSGMTLDPVPFGSPPPEVVTIEGELPWELRDEVPFLDTSLSGE